MILENIPSPQFRARRFKTRYEFVEWLTQNQHIVIEFEDNGGDLFLMHVHESGEILHCNAHEQIYNGAFVLMSDLRVGDPVCIIIPHMKDRAYRRMNALIVKDLKFNHKRA